MATEQRAFAAVHRDTGVIDLTSIAADPPSARSNFSGSWRNGWAIAYREGWRIRPVIIRIEDAEEPSHDRR